MLDDRMLPVLEEALSTHNQLPDAELTAPERFFWESLLYGAIRLQRGFDEYRHRAWFASVTTPEVESASARRSHTSAVSNSAQVRHDHWVLFNSSSTTQMLPKPLAT